MTKLKILCSGYLVRYPLGGHVWHHLQYLIGFQRLGHEVAFFENWGWPDSCYDPQRDEMTSDPQYGIRFIEDLLRPHGLGQRWCYLAQSGFVYGMSRGELTDWCKTCDLYLNLSNMNWIAELENCRRRVLVDTDPVFTQIGAHGVGGPFDRYHALFTYGENVHQPDSSMPDGGARWHPTRQPIVLDLWPAAIPKTGDCDPAPWTSVMNWSAYGDHESGSRVYGQKDREFEPYFDLPRRAEESMELAVSAPPLVQQRLIDGGWKMADPLAVSRSTQSYQDFISRSRGEWCVAKHAYVQTQCGWFSDRSAAYLAMGKPVVLQDTGFSRNLPCGQGLIPFSNPDEARAALRTIRGDYAAHCRAARRIAESCFDSNRVLSQLIERSM